MTRRYLLQLAEDLLTIPTAPYHEQGVRSFVIEYCRRHGLDCGSDATGNLVARYRHDGPAVPLVLVAHMDHPGFEACGGARAQFLGSVPPACFPGATVRFYTADGVRKKRIRRVLSPSLWPKRKFLELIDGDGLRQGDFGMWDLPLYRVKGERLTATAIDDVLSVAVTLATLVELKRRRVKTHVWGVFTRAEEIGFQGALAIARRGVIPRRALVVSMEMSRERPWARMGQGPVIRIGDRLSVFDGAAATFFEEVGNGLRRRDGQYRFQRALMDGGSCEATVFRVFGYRVLGLCLPLGNYHNIGPGNRPRAEYIDLRDLQGLLRLTVAGARQWKDYPQLVDGLRQRVLAVNRNAPRQLTPVTN